MSRSGDGRLQEVLAAAVQRILRPLIRILLRHGVAFGAFADLAKRVYVEVASSDEFRIGRRKQTVSRIAIITGLTRKEVRRVLELPVASAGEEAGRYSRSARVISGWSSDPRFLDAQGAPKDLAIDTGFTELVRRYSGDMPVRAVLDELLRVSAVSQSEDGRVRLRLRAYVPSAAETDVLEILGTDVAALTTTIDHNMASPPDSAWFQRKVLYDNLPEEALPLLRALASEEGQGLLESLNAQMRVQDRDCNPDVRGSGRRTAMVGVYYYECETPDDPEGEPR